MTTAQHREGSHRQSKYRLLIGLLSILILSIGISQIILAEKAITLSSSSSSSSSQHHHAQHEQISSISKQQPPQPTKQTTTTNTDAIVYLAQFSQVHSTYGTQHDIENNTISGHSKLSKSLDLLYTNYIHNNNHLIPTNNNNHHHVDILIFYIPEEGVPTHAIMEELQLANRPQVKLHPLNSTYWSLPPNLNERDPIHWKRPMYSIGYRHMMRWFAILIWPYLGQLGYTHVMRLDDDSYIHSRIKYNLFDYMRDNGKVYAFRQPVIEEGVGDGWDELVDDFLDGYYSYSNNNKTNDDTITTNVTTILLQQQQQQQQQRIEDFKKDRRISFYNNFFIADISFFTKPPASTFLNMIDQSNLIYTQRTGDLVIHSTVVRLLVPPDQIHWFRDFSYEHMTLCRTSPKCGFGVLNGCPQNGGLSRGVGTYTDEEWSAITLDVKRKVQYDDYKVMVMGDEPDRNCLWMIRFKTYVGARDVMECLKRTKRCYPYLKHFLDDNEAAETGTMIPS